jgi:uncharacterized LabA/DUF88 family protein
MDPRIAVFLDYENLAISARQDLGVTFDYGPIADAIASRGRVVVRKAYADWTLFDEDRKKLTRHHIELIEIPQRMGASRKNAADIKLAVDAVEMALSRDYIDTFVLGTGDSDFSPVVHKLRELDKTVIGVGVEKTTSALLPPACDEFLFYERLGGLEARTEEERHPSDLASLEKLVARTLGEMERTGDAAPLASQLKRIIVRKDPTFTETEYGFRSFGELIRHLAEEGVVETAPGPASGDPVLSLASGGGEEVAFAALAAAAGAGNGKAVQLSGLKDQLRKADPTFSEKKYGYGGFLQFAKAAKNKGFVTLEFDEGSGDWLVGVPKG